MAEYAQAQNMGYDAHRLPEAHPEMGNPGRPIPDIQEQIERLATINKILRENIACIESAADRLFGESAADRLFGSSPNKLLGDPMPTVASVPSGHVSNIRENLNETMRLADRLSALAGRMDANS